MAILKRWLCAIGLHRWAEVGHRIKNMQATPVSWMCLRSDCTARKGEF